MDAATAEGGGGRWSALPSDIVTTIARLLSLNPPFSLLSLRAVCPSWRSALSNSLSHPSFPLIVPPPTAPYCSFKPTTNPGPFTAFRTTVLRLSPLSSSSSSSWLLKVSETKPNTFSLLNPLTTDKIKSDFPIHINLLHYRISEITHSYHLKFAATSPVYVRRLVLIPHHTLLLLSYGGRLERLSLGDHCWVSILGKNNDKRDPNFHFDDVICFHNQCYAVTTSGVLVKFDLDFNPIQMTSPLGFSPGEHKYLVPSDDDLYLISKVSDPDSEFYYDYFEDEYILNEETFAMPIRIRVFKLNRKQGDWDFYSGLDDKALFLGDDVSFSLSARDFHGCRGNCIYLTDECFFQEEDEDNVYGQDTGLYAMDERLVVGLAACPEYARVFWPPPPWLLQGSCSSAT